MSMHLDEAAGSTRDIEQRILHHLEENWEEAVRFLERVVNINSGTMNPQGVREVGKLFQAEFDQLGFQTRWIPMDEVNRAGHLFARRQGSQGKKLLLIGHLDTVYEADSPFQKALRRGNILRGPGVQDMKGGDVMILYALKALHAAGGLRDTDITVALVGDEEDTGDPLSVSRRDLIEAARHADIALGFEGGELETATVARRGFTGWELRVTAEPGHSSQIFEKEFGAGALYEAARVLHAFYQELRGEKHLTFSAGIILGGTTADYDPVLSRGRAFGKTNIIPETAIVAGDLRTISEEQRSRVKDRMLEIAARSLPGTSSSLEFQDSYPPMAPTPGNYDLLARLDRVSRDLGLGPVRAVDPGQRGAADVSFAAPHVEAALDSLGAAGTGAHTDQEQMKLDSSLKMLKRAAILIYRLTRAEESIGGRP